MRTLAKRLRVAGAWAVAMAFCFAVIAGNPALAQAAGGNDGALQTAVSQALSHDPVLKNQPVIAAASSGVVTLSGSVETQQQREQAETDAAKVPGVSGIENNITVTGSSGTGQSGQSEAGPAIPSDQQAPPPIDQQEEQNTPLPPPDQAPSPDQNSQAMPPPPPPDQQSSEQPSYPPQRPNYNYPQPVSGPVTIPAGTLVQIRLSEPLDVAHVQPGAVFQATAASDVYEGNVLAIPRGAVLQGTVVDAKKPGALGGKGILNLKLTQVSLGGRSYPVTTDLWSSQTPNKAGYTAGNTVGGALIGAIIGGVIGRGPGAAAGAIVGGGAGMAASAASRGPGSYLPAESLLNFHLAGPVTVQPVSWQEAQRLAQNAPRLMRRPMYRPYPAYPAGYPPPYPYPYAYPYPYPYRVYAYPYPY